MELPAEKTEIERDLAKKSIFLYGNWKVGKTTLASQAKDPIFICTEPGFRSVQINKLPPEKNAIIETWAQFLDACNAIFTSGDRYSTVVIDTIDNAWDLCTKHICDEYGVKHPNDKPIGFGKGYDQIAKEMKRVVNKLASTGRGLIMISHEEKEHLKDDSTRTVPTLHKHGRRPILSLADVTLWMTADMAKRPGGESYESVILLRGYPNKYFESGSRGGHFPRDIILPPPPGDGSWDTLVKEHDLVFKDEKKPTESTQAKAKGS